MKDDDAPETPEAVAKHIDDVVTGAIAAAERRGRGVGRRHTDHALTPPPKTIAQHELECMRPGGGLYLLGEKVDALRVTDIKGKLLMSAAIVLIPVGLAIWTNIRSNDRLAKQIEVAAEVAKQLKAVQEAAKGHSEMQADAPKVYFTAVAP